MDKPIQGFTLIELMISITIVGLVFGIIASSTTLVRKNSHDTQRHSDLRSIQSALEQYYADQLFYPATISFGSALTNATGNVAGTTISKTYLNRVLQDPSGGSATYKYEGLKNDPSSPTSYSLCDNITPSLCLKYCLYASLENPPNPLLPTYSYCSATGFNLQVTSP